MSALVQKKMQTVSKGKGLTVMVMDDNKREMPNLSDMLYRADPWFDGLYQKQQRVHGKQTWVPRTDTDRFDHIVNTAFAIKSEHSSLVQVADALSYIYRRHLELQSENEAYDGESEFYSDLIGVIEPKREKIGRSPVSDALNFYRATSHDHWKI